MTKYLGCNMSMMPAVIFVLVILIFLPFETPAMTVKTVAAGEDDQNQVEEMMSSSGHEEDFMNWAGYGEEKLSVVTVTGRVVCRDPCHSKPSNVGIAQLPSFPISGATVSISCGTKGSRKYRVQATTDENGDFFIELPSHLHAIPNLHKFSFAKLLHLPKEYSHCRPRRNSGRKQMIRGIKLLSTTENGVRAYVAETMHLTPISSKGCKFNQRTN